LNDSDYLHIKARIKALSDLDATHAIQRLAEYLAPAVTTGPTVAGDDVNLALVDAFHRSAQDDASQLIGGTECSSISRDLLTAFAMDPNYRDVVIIALDTTPDDQLLSRPILALGVAATLIILAATTEVRLDIGPLHLHKQTASPKLLEAVANILQPYKPRSSP
jgi:hypothetical protein